MKYLLCTIPLALVVTGCGQGATDNGAATGVNNVSTASNITSNTTSDTNSTTQNSDNTASSTSNTSNTSNTTSSTKDITDTAAPMAAADTSEQYRVADEPTMGLPPQVIQALKKVKVPPPPASLKAPSKATLRLDTSKGPITVQVDGKAAPLHVKSFIYLTKRGFYNGTVWHRYVPEFVIQGGDPISKFPALSKYFGTGGPGYQVPREYNDLKHKQYVLAMARSDDPNSAGSQFYITLKPTPELDEGPGYTVFGKVTAGQKVVDALRGGDKLKSVKVLSETP